MDSAGGMKWFPLIDSMNSVASHKKPLAYIQYLPAVPELMKFLSHSAMSGTFSGRWESASIEKQTVDIVERPPEYNTIIEQNSKCLFFSKQFYGLLSQLVNSQMTALQDDRLKSLLELMTTSGKSELDAAQVSELKQICKQHHDYVENAHGFITKQLRKKHSEVRLSCLQITCVLFEKSSYFRELLLNNFQEFLQLVTGYNALGKPRQLPPPANVAKRLRSRAIDVVHEWMKKYGETYPRLEVAVRFLELQQKLERCSFNDSSSQHNAADRRQHAHAGVLARKAQRARDELEERKSEIDECLVELRNAIELLVPRLDDFTQTGALAANSGSDKLKVGATVSQPRRLPHDELVIELNTNSLRTQRTGDNAVVLDSLSERLKQVDQTILPELRTWLNTFQASEGFEDAVKNCIDYKNLLVELQNKASVLGVESKSSRGSREAVKNSAEADDDDDEFVDVAGSIMTPVRHGSAPAGVIDRLLLETEFGGSCSPPATENAESSTVSSRAKPASPEKTNQNINSILHPAASETPVEDKLTTPQQKVKLSPAPPVIPYGIDLEYWGREKQLTAPERVAPLDAVWSMQSGDKLETAEAAAAARTRTFAFRSEWKPVEHICRMPMKNGKLCSRQDRSKCPLHGLIIPRNAVGQPIDPEQAANLTASQRKGVLGHLIKNSEQHDKPWQDVSLLRDIEAETGRFLGAAGSTRKARSGVHKSKRPKYPNLTELSVAKNTVEKRLERKLFKSDTVKRVGESMDRDVRARNDDKFRHQWNYSM